MAGEEINFGDNEFIVSKTDLGGRITYGNALFIKISGYEEDELIGAPHKILRNPDMPSLIFKLLWETIKQGEEIFAYVVNKTKQGGYYWVFAHVTPSMDSSGKIIGYHSVRRKPTQQALAVIKPLYTQLLRDEKSGGISASQKYLDTLLQQKGVSYEEFILAL
ncbi:MAG: PAS domain-containing protein [Campylobacterales bacterium]|nr:PAS domain-containing protein [Campylobacterales bacterium]